MPPTVHVYIVACICLVSITEDTRTCRLSGSKDRGVEREVKREGTTGSFGAMYMYMYMYLHP